MAIRARNVALEGIAHDYYDPLVLAVVGFADADGTISASAATESPAQDDDVDVTVTPLTSSAGGGRRIRPRVYRRAVPKPVSVEASSESPAQTDEVACRVFVSLSVVSDAAPSMTGSAGVQVVRPRWRSGRDEFRQTWRLAERRRERI